MSTRPTPRPSRLLRIGMVGAGNISGQYLETLGRLPELHLTAVADLNPERAAEVAAAHRAQALGVQELINSPEVDLVLNLTIPQAHAEIALAAITAGKAVYTEKPLAASTAEAQRIIQAGQDAGVVVGAAPDTVLGTGVQTARAVIDAGDIGTPVAATATMIIPGHEAWHPNPDFYYQPGGGPLMDMGPYYLTALVTMLGPVTEVHGAASALRSQRRIGSGPRAGEQILVSTPSHVTGILVHASGALSTVVMSFDGMATHAAPIEIHGSEGSLSVPDPNHFSGDVMVHRGDRWQQHTERAGYRHAARGYGIADLLWSGAFDGDRLAGVCQAGVAMHVLEIMEAVLHAAQTGGSATISSTLTRPAAVPLEDR